MGLGAGPPPSWCSSRPGCRCLQAFSLLCASPWLGSRGLHLGSVPGCCYLWKLGNCSWKKLVGALPTAPLRAVTCRARVRAVVFKGGVRLWKPASACPESVWEPANRGTNAPLPWLPCDLLQTALRGEPLHFLLCIPRAHNTWGKNDSSLFLRLHVKCPGL